jgi:hypothetical protein
MTEIRTLANSVSTSVRVNRTANVVRSTTNTNAEAVNNISSVKVVSKTDYVVKELAQVIENTNGTHILRYVTTIGDGAANSFVITHNSNTNDIIVQIRDIASGEYVDASITITSPNTLTIETGIVPALNSLRVIVHG